MPKALDPLIVDVLKKYGEDAKAACWDCHGTWVVLHKALERVATKAKISFDPPQVIQADAEKKTVAICVTGQMEGRAEWSIGEAAPYNNKNSYPFAMAEKRAKDRVILKLVGLHGLLYSEDEADDFKADPGKPANDTPAGDDPMTRKNPPGRSAVVTEVREKCRELHSCGDAASLLAFIDQKEFKQFVFKVCSGYPNDWIGPEDNSGLKGTMMQVAQQVGCEFEVRVYIEKAEAAAKEAVTKQAAE